MDINAIKLKCLQMALTGNDKTAEATVARALEYSNYILNERPSELTTPTKKTRTKHG